MEFNLNELLKAIQTTFDTVMRQVDLDTSSLAKTAEFVSTEDTLIIKMGDYAQYVDSGRGAGRMPPVADIVDWINRKAISVPMGVTVTSLAYAIAKSISKKGVKPRPFMEALNEQVNGLVLEYINNKVVEQLKGSLDNQ